MLIFIYEHSCKYIRMIIINSCFECKKLYKGNKCLALMEIYVRRHQKGLDNTQLQIDIDNFEPTENISCSG